MSDVGACSPLIQHLPGQDMTFGRFVGADPSALVGLAETLEQYLLRVRASGMALQVPLTRRSASCDSLLSILVSVESDLAAEAEELRWRASLIHNAQGIEPVFSALAGSAQHRIEFASLAVFDIGDREAALRKWLTVPDPIVLQAMAPGEIGMTFAAMGPSLADDYARSHPDLVGALDGAPPHLRYVANEVLIAAKIAELQDQIAEGESTKNEWWSRSLKPRLLFDWVRPPELVGVLTARCEQQISEFQRWLDEGRQILLFDPAADGRVVEVFGDLAAADRAAVVVPGMGNSLHNFSENIGGFRENAARLYEASLDLGSPSVATIAWLGYDSPDGIGAAARGAATEGAPALCRFVEGIDPRADKQVTIVAHSYGSVVAGVAAGGGLSADNLVFVGSPGTSLDHAADAILRPGGRVWVALADGDPIGLGISPSELPPSWVPAPLFPVVLAMDMANEGPEELWHGSNPASEGFGAARLATEGSSGHSAYFEAGSLHNLALVVQGLYDDVKLVP